MRQYRFTGNIRNVNYAAPPPEQWYYVLMIFVPKMHFREPQKGSKWHKNMQNRTSATLRFAGEIMSFPVVVDRVQNALENACESEHILRICPKNL